MKSRTEQQAHFWQRLAAELDLGEPLVRSLDTVTSELGDKDLRTALASVQHAICGGSTFAAALEALPEQFTLPVITMICGGELAGTLDVSCRKLADGFAEGIFTVPGETAVCSPALRQWQLFLQFLDSGVPILQTLSVIAGNTDDPAAREAWGRVGEAVRSGEAISSAMADHPSVFPAGVVAAIRRGESQSDVSAALRTIVDAVKNDCVDSLVQEEASPSSTVLPDDQPVIRMVSQLIVDAYKARASDIHLEPLEDGRLQVRLRIDGVMRPHRIFDATVRPQVTSRIKIMGGLNVAEKRLPQDGRIQLKIADKPLDLRVSVVASALGERMTVRILSRDQLAILTLDMLGLAAPEREHLGELLSRGHGTIISTGPTGSGKTTTMYCILKELDHEKMAIFSVEHPIEYTIPGVSQIGLQPNIGLTYAIALRSVLRQDPDVIMISEITDFATAAIAAQASITGHLVLTQLHTTTAAGAFTRLLDIGLEPFLVSDTVSGVINQRLVRKLCEHCRKPAELPLKRLPKQAVEFAESLADSEYYEPVGCDRCNSGYRGRAAIHEVLVVSDALREAIGAKADTASLHKIAVEQGMVPILQDGIRKAALGVTSIQEVMRVAGALLP